MKIFFVLILINLLAAHPVLAEEPAAPATPGLPSNPVSTEMSLEQATKQVVSGAAGRVLSAKTEDIDGKKMHVIKILTEDGRIQQQIVDAQSGALVDKDIK